MKTHDYYQKRALTRLAIVAIVVFIAAGATWLVLRSDSFQKILSIETTVQHIASEELGKSFSAPEPLVGATTTPAKAGDLTRVGVIARTNQQRAENGNLPALTENKTLDEIAVSRLNDMFTKQYFAHVSPASSSAETVAATVGYDYIALGENLALGNFEGDHGVVVAWMNSPGHRANILDTHYTEIGVAVGQGRFQGSNAWIAVQVFGRPASACPAPDPKLKTKIDDAQGQITETQSQLQSMKAQLDAMRPKSGDQYAQAVNTYNILVDQYNTVVAQAKAEIAQYNDAVNAFNTCIGS